MKKAIIIIYLFVITVVLTGCNSISAKNSLKDSKTVVIHDIKYSNRGSRSEGRSGYLKISGYILPDCFMTVVADGKIYKFKTKNTSWGDDGYFTDETENVESVYPATNKNISNADLERGWSEVPGRYVNIPGNWIFVKWQNGSAALLPEKINELVKNKSLKMIPRNTFLLLKKPFK